MTAVAAAELARPAVPTTVGLLTKGSLCSGYGGLDLATPGTLQFVADINADANAVLAREYPQVPNLGDVAVRHWSSRDHVGLLTAGFPCQPVSAAGPQKAQKDVRWLWPDVLDVIRRTRPDEVFLENVQNIISIQHGAVLVEILTELREACYECRWTVLGACAVGAPHHRHRWFLRGRRTRRAGEAVRLKSQCGAPRTGGRMLLPTPTVTDGTGGPFGHRDGGLNLRSAVMLLPSPAARDGDPRGRGEGDAKFWAARAEYRTNGMPLGAAVALLPTPLASHGERGRGNCGQTFTAGSPSLGHAASADQWGKFARAVALWEAITGRCAPEPTEPATKGGRRLNPALSEWMMGLPRGMVTSGLQRPAALRLAGNGVVPAHAAAAYELLAGETR